MRFKTWIESSDLMSPGEEWTFEDIEQEARSANSLDVNEFDPPDDCSPDDFYCNNHNNRSVFTFTYSQRKIKDPSANEYKTEGLRLAGGWTAHSTMFYNSQTTNPEKLKTICGRYGLYNKTTPIVAIWGGVPSLKEPDPPKNLLLLCIKELLSRQLIHPQAYLYYKSDNKGSVSQFFKNANHDINKTNDEKVQIGNKLYSLHEIPALLHFLPRGSPEWKEIANFICQDTKHPFLAQFKTKAGCGENDIVKPTVPNFITKRDYWNTSESWTH